MSSSCSTVVDMSSLARDVSTSSKVYGEGEIEKNQSYEAFRADFPHLALDKPEPVTAPATPGPIHSRESLAALKRDILTATEEDGGGGVGVGEGGVGVGETKAERGGGSVGGTGTGGDGEEEEEELANLPLPGEVSGGRLSGAGGAKSPRILLDNFVDDEDLDSNASADSADSADGDNGDCDDGGGDGGDQTHAPDKQTEPGETKEAAVRLGGGSEGTQGTQGGAAGHAGAAESSADSAARRVLDSAEREIRVTADPEPQLRSRHRDDSSDE